MKELIKVVAKKLFIYSIILCQLRTRQRFFLKAYFIFLRLEKMLDIIIFVYYAILVLRIVYLNFSGEVYVINSAKYNNIFILHHSCKKSIKNSTNRSNTWKCGHKNKNKKIKNIKTYKEDIWYRRSNC